MIGLGLRLVVNGGREAVTRLVILTVAVGLGVGLLLTAVADRDGQDEQPGDRLAAAADHQPQAEGDHGWAPVSVLTLPSLTTTSRSA